MLGNSLTGSTKTKVEIVIVNPPDTFFVSDENKTSSLTTTATETDPIMIDKELLVTLVTEGATNQLGYLLKI